MLRLITMEEIKPGYLESEHQISEMLWKATDNQGVTSDMLVDFVYKALWKQIVEGVRQQGEQLYDTDIAKELGVSRTPVRQALHQLQRSGLVQTGERRGFHVTIFTQERIREIYDFRSILEVAAIRSAVPNIDIAQLEKLLAELKQIQNMEEPERGIAFMHSDIELHHELIGKSSNNQLLSQAIAQLRAQISLFLLGGARSPARNDVAIKDHVAILEALLERNPDKAAQAMAEHIQHTKDLVMKEYASSRPRSSSYTLRAFKG
jgi:DNA-binding GntR family transcriptional regulator